MKKNHLFVAFLALYASFAFAQANIYTPCYYMYASLANELYKNGDIKAALPCFEQARASAQAYHRADVVAVAACYAAAGDSTTAFALLKTAIDKGRRLDWFEGVYYFDKIKKMPKWKTLEAYTPRIRNSQRARTFHDLIHGLNHELEAVFMEMEKDPNAAARLPVLDSAAAAILVETISTIGVPNEGELDDEDIQEFLGLYIKVGMYDQKTYFFLRENAIKMLQNGIFRPKEYAAIIDNWNSQWGQTGNDGDTLIPVFGNDQTNINALSKEALQQTNDNRIAIGLLPFGADISPESQAKIQAIAKKICTPEVKVKP